MGEHQQFAGPGRAPDLHAYNSAVGGSGHAANAYNDSNYEGTSDEDRDSNRPGTYEFLKYNTRHLTAEVLFCASMGNLRRLKMVLNKAGKTIRDENYADYDKRTPLHIAASDGSVFVTNWLLEQGGRKPPGPMVDDAAGGSGVRGPPGHRADVGQGWRDDHG